MLLPLFLSPLLAQVHAQITVHRQAPVTQEVTGTGTAAAANYTGSAAANPSVLDPPPLPNPLPNLNFDIQLVDGGTPGVSIPHKNPFWGFSIEMSVTNQLFGLNGSYLNVPLLNLFSAITTRAGELHVRVGGNTQESAVLVEKTASGHLLEKDYTVVSGTTNTPPIVYSVELLYMMANISSLLPVKWYLGIPFNDTNFRMDIVRRGHEILGDNLLALQAANEPDFYPGRRRPETYGPGDYTNEVGMLIDVMQAPEYDAVRNSLIVPSITGAHAWTAQQVWDTGLVERYHEQIKLIAFERYPSDNCFFQFGTGTERHAQDMFPMYLSHQSPRQLAGFYTGALQYAVAQNKEVIMFETNTASCGGFPGVSNSYGAALWGLDYGLQMAYLNFSQALFHVGGQSVFYNPFTAPPTNMSAYAQWTIGPVFYSTMIMAEIIGNTGTAQVLDLQANEANDLTPAYAIYENGTPVRLALFNYMNDPTHAADITTWIAVGGGTTGQPGTTPTEVKVKYFESDSVSQLFNYTWAGQTFGGAYQSDGRLKGELRIDTVQCDTTQGKCPIRIPSPGFALVFLTDTTSTSGGDPTATFATTAFTRLRNTATVDPKVLETSNGHRGLADFLGSTSPGTGARHGNEGMVVRVSVVGLAMIFGLCAVLLK